IKDSIYDPEHLIWKAPMPIFPYTHNWDRPAIDWKEIEEGIKLHGIRNAAQTTIAPTGTIATVAGCEGYGCEPVFALAYIRHVNDNGKDLQLNYTSPLFEKALIEAGIKGEQREKIISHVMEHGSCQGIEGVPEDIQKVFVVSTDITAEEHVRMQAAMQVFVDNSLSKTINFPAHATVEDVMIAYQLAWQLGCKGITVYVTGSREKVVLETKATAKKKSTTEEEEERAVRAEQIAFWQEQKKPRPRALHGFTYSINTPLGKAFITINENGDENPFEVFINTAKAGSDTAAVSEAIGRLISYILRLASPVNPRERLKEVWRQLSGIGGGRSLGFGPTRVRSLPDGVAQVLAEYLEQKESDSSARYAITTTEAEEKEPSVNNQPYKLDFEEDESTGQLQLKIGDLCPECGQAALVNEEGCRKCYACGYSEC
ncbi:MAG: ribonucleoside-diphosphate reductase, adenosylcobalamin-dependent, partial [Anaerolineales bacterium]